MYRLALLFACLVLCHGHAIFPVVPAVHAVHTAPLLYPYPLAHGYAGHGLYSQGLLAKPHVHHLLKRSPHLVAPITAVSPLAVSHQSRVDVHSSPVLSPLVPLVKPLVTPFVAAPLVHKALVPSPYYGLGHFGGVYSPHY